MAQIHAEKYVNVFCISVESGVDFITSGANFCWDRSLQTQLKSGLDFAKLTADFDSLQNYNFDSYYSKNYINNQKSRVYLMAIEFVGIRSNFIKIILNII